MEETTTLGEGLWEPRVRLFWAFIKIIALTLLTLLTLTDGTTVYVRRSCAFVKYLDPSYGKFLANQHMLFVLWFSVVCFGLLGVQRSASGCLGGVQKMHFT